MITNAIHTVRHRWQFTRDVLDFLAEGRVPANAGYTSGRVQWVSRNCLGITLKEKPLTVTIDGADLGAGPFWEEVRVHFKLYQNDLSASMAIEGEEKDIEYVGYLSVIYFTFSSLLSWSKNFESFAMFVQDRSQNW